MSAAESSKQSIPPALDQSAETVLLEWTVHLLRRDPARAAVVAAAIGAAGALGLLLFHSLLVGLVGALLLFSSAAEYLLPIRYRLTSRGAYATWGASRLELSWRDVRRVLPDRDGLKLSPLAEPSRLDAFRGILLRFAQDGHTGDRAQVTSVVDSRTENKGDG